MDEVKEMLRSNPALDINWRDVRENGCSALHQACESGHDSIVSILLAHPGIDVNAKDDSGKTPFFTACDMGSTSCVRLLLQDQLVMIDEPDNDGGTSLRRAAYCGHYDVIKLWIASGREMDLGKPGDIYKTDVIGAAKKYRRTEVVTLLERFKENPEETRQAARVGIDWYNSRAVEMFALVIFVSDELLQIKETVAIQAMRFFSIVRKLPLELQMVLCHRSVGSTKEIIQRRDSEVAFKSLAESLLWSSIFTN